MVNLGELVMILDLHREGLSVSAIARQLELDRKTVRKYIARDPEPPTLRSPRPSRRVLLPCCHICANGLEPSQASPPCCGGNCANEQRRRLEYARSSGFFATALGLSALRPCAGVP